MKKVLYLFTILFFSTNLFAEEIIMKCKHYRYKFISDTSGVSIYSAHIKRDKKKYHKFCATEVRDDNKHFLKSIEGVEMIITDYKVTCLTAKGVMKNGYRIRSFITIAHNCRGWSLRPSEKNGRCGFSKLKNVDFNFPRRKNYGQQVWCWHKKLLVLAIYTSNSK